jgi:ferric-dicitrate binding protein FerR (iron transport regulator)
MSDLDRDDGVRDLLRQARPAGQVDPARAARVRTAVHEVWLQETPRSSGRWWWFGAAAAAMLVAALVLSRQPPVPSSFDAGERVLPDGAAVEFVRGNVRISRGESAAARPALALQNVDIGETVTTGDGHGTIRRSDGVAIRIDRDTRITVVPGPGTQAGVTIERGAVYIDTSGREGTEPLVVTAHAAVLQDIGTRYEVRVAGDAVRVRVRDGRVRATRGGKTDEATPGMQLVADSRGITLSEAPTFGADWDWIVRAVLPPPVHDRSLAEFLAWVERESGRRVRFGDRSIEASAATTRVYGVIDGLSIEEALIVVLASCALEHRTDGPTITIVAARETGGGR